MHRRRPGEYVRPAGRYQLMDNFPDTGSRYRRVLRGFAFNADPFTGRATAGCVVDLELVAERFNAHDLQAVAVDYAGARLGYLPAGEAACWHDVLLAMNRAGQSVWTRGELKELDAEGQPVLSPVVSVPNYTAVCDLAEEFGLMAVFERLLTTVGPDVRAEMLEWAWEDFPAPLVRKVARHADSFPALTWPTHPPAGLRSHAAIPGILPVLLKEKVVLERQLQAQARHEAAFYAKQQRAAAREAAKAAAKETRETRQRGRRQALLDAAAAGLAQGQTNREIAADLGVSSATVTTLRSELRGGQAWDRNAEQQLARLERAKIALALQRQGLSLQQIAEQTSVSQEGVTSLLRDAKFHTDLASDVPRWDRAQAAKRAKAQSKTRRQFQDSAQLSASKAEEAWMDASLIAALAEQPRPQ